MTLGRSLSSRQLFALSFLCAMGLLAASALSAWTGPTATAPAGNVSAPINVGSSDQVKNAGLAVNSLLVSGSAAVYSGTGQVKLGVNTSNPLVPLDVAGTVKIGNTGEQCQAVSAGALRWNSTSKTIDFCNGTAWQALSTTTPASAPAVTPQTYTFSAAGTHAFAIVPYNTMRVRVWGGGGGGGEVYGGGGSAGGTSSFNYALYAYGGNPGVGYTSGTGGGFSGGSGANGSAACGGAVESAGRVGQCTDYGYGGSSPNGGAGGSPGATGAAPGGGGGGGTGSSSGGGGGGGYTEYTYNSGQFTAGAIVTIVVGGGGAGAPSGYPQYYSNGGSGGVGRVQIIIN